MASSAVITAVNARVLANWAVTDPATNQPAVFYGLNDKGETPQDGSAFLIVQYPVANASQISVGAPGAQLYREEGGIRFVLAIQRGQGVAWWMGQLETLLTAFRGVKFSNIRTFAPTSPVLDDTNDAGTYWRLTAVVPYQTNNLG